MTHLTWRRSLLLLAIALISCTMPTTRPASQDQTALPSADTGQSHRLILATTTSTEDSGLLAYILPDFERQYGIKVDVIAVGTGQALKLGQDGNADVLLVHAPALEEAFMAAGHGVRRVEVMYNDFVIVGPPGDPAGVRGMTEVTKALIRIAASQARFISRGDASGTHAKEMAMWAAAGIEPIGPWYISAGQGMDAVLTVASEQQAYTLADRATYLVRKRQGLELDIVFEGDQALRNPYSVIAVNPNKGAHMQAERANTFIDWLISLPVQERIAAFGVEAFGTPLFTPNAPAWQAAHGSAEGGS